MKTQQGYLYEVIAEDFYDTGKGDDLYNPIPNHIPKGTILEIRYPFEWNFRTNTIFKNIGRGIWGHSDEQNIHDKCKLIGRVNPYIKSMNHYELSEILEMKLFDTLENGVFIDMGEDRYLWVFQNKVNEVVKSGDNDFFTVAERLRNSLGELFGIAKAKKMGNLLSEFSQLYAKFNK